MDGVMRRWMGQMGGGEWGWVGPFFGCVRVGGKTFLVGGGEWGWEHFLIMPVLNSFVTRN